MHEIENDFRRMGRPGPLSLQIRKRPKDTQQIKKSYTSDRASKALGGVSSACPSMSRTKTTG